MAESVPSEERVPESGYLGRGLTGPASARISLMPNDKRGRVHSGDDDEDDDDNESDVVAIVATFEFGGGVWTLSDPIPVRSGHGDASDSVSLMSPREGYLLYPPPPFLPSLFLS